MSRWSQDFTESWMGDVPTAGYIRNLQIADAMLSGSGTPGAGWDIYGDSYGNMMTGEEAIAGLIARNSEGKVITDPDIIKAMWTSFTTNTRTLYGTESAIAGSYKFLQADSHGDFYIPYTDQKVDINNFLVSISRTGNNGSLDGLQTTLDLVGLIPGIGEVADGINAVIYLSRGDYTNASFSAAAMIPFLGWGATGAKLSNKAYKVYYAVAAAGNVKYVGITSREVTQELVSI